MADFIYTSPLGNWAIVAHQSQEWQDIFGLDSIGYNICKNDNDSGEMENQSGWQIIEWKQTIGECFLWLLARKIISGDECTYQLEKFGSME